MCAARPSGVSARVPARVAASNASASSSRRKPFDRCRLPTPAKQRSGGGQGQSERSRVVDWEPGWGTWCSPVAIGSWREESPPSGDGPLDDESPAYAGLSRVRRRGLEPPPGYPGSGPQPCNPGVRSVLCVQSVQNERKLDAGRNGRSGCCRGCCRRGWPFPWRGSRGVRGRPRERRDVSPVDGVVRGVGGGRLRS
jgi:hypothetical protein